MPQTRTTLPESRDLIDIYDIGTPSVIDEDSKPVVINGATEIPDIHGATPARVLFQDEDSTALVEEQDITMDYGGAETTTPPEAVSLQEHATGIMQPHDNIEQVPAQEVQNDVEDLISVPPVNAAPRRERVSSRRDTSSGSTSQERTVTTRVTRRGTAVRNYKELSTKGKVSLIGKLFIATTLELEPIDTQYYVFNTLTPVKALRKYPRAAFESIGKEIFQLNVEKQAFKPVDVKCLQRVSSIRSSGRQCF